LLTADEISKGSKRATSSHNNKFIPETVNTCWPIEQPPKCSFWSKILGTCNCEEK
jgi:hypothetical protein